MTEKTAITELLALLLDNLREELEDLGMEDPQLERMLSEIRAYGQLAAVAADLQTVRRAEKFKGLSAVARHALQRAAPLLTQWEKRQLAPPLAALPSPTRLPVVGPEPEDPPTPKPRVVGPTD